MADRKANLEDLRDILWTSIQEVGADKRAALANQYRATLTELATLADEDEKAGDSIDEIAARRAARGGATARLGQASRRPG